MSKVGRKKLPAEKLSELEFEIKILEQNESLLPEGEIVRLNNLREKNEFQKKQGWHVIRTVPVKLLDRYKSKIQGTETPTPDSPDSETIQNNPAKSALKKKKIAHGFNYYVSQTKLKHAQENPKAALNMEIVILSWKKLSPVEKIKYKELAQEVLDTTDASENDTNFAKVKKRERDRNYQQKKAKVLKQGKSEIDAFTKDFESILKERKVKLDNLKKLEEELKKEILLACSENDIVTKMVADQDEEELSLKLKIKEIFNHHKICKKK